MREESVARSVRAGRKNLKSEMRKRGRRKEVAWKDEIVERKMMDIYGEDKRRVQTCLLQNRSEVNEQFGRK